MGNKTNTKMGDSTGGIPPDIFKAAELDDIHELAKAIEDGQSLSERRHDLLHMTPVHIACLHASNAFIEIASNHESFDPWIRDDNQRLAFDHAAAHNNQIAMKLLYSKMYPPDWANRGKVVSISSDAPR